MDAEVYFYFADFLGYTTSNNEVLNSVHEGCLGFCSTVHLKPVRFILWSRGRVGELLAFFF
jgi:hypothetical protein